MPRRLDIHRGLPAGFSRNPDYQIWKDMLRRVRSDSPRAKDYFSRGIRVCTRLTNLYSELSRVIGSSRPPDHTLERVDNDGHYSCGNCPNAGKIGGPKISVGL